MPEHDPEKWIPVSEKIMLNQKGSGSPLAGDCMSNYLIRQRADAQFRKLPGLEDGNSAQSDYEAAADALAAKIARLKELRLARDAAVLAAPPPVAAKKAGKRKKQNKPKKPPALSLADWLKNRQAGAGS
jgi:hypothetical protein